MDSGPSPQCPRCAQPGPGRRCERCGVCIVAGGFAVQRVLSEAGQSRTYLASSADGELVVLEELLFSAEPDARALAAFASEGERLVQLRHPDLPGYVAHFREGEGRELRLYLARRHVEGPSLLEELGQRRTSELEVRQLANQLLAILDHLHRLTPPILHRDVNPATVLRRADGRLALVGFGSARDAVVRAMQGATQSGTVGYAPPEQLAGVVTPGSDVYAVAATLLHLLTRQAPWELIEAGFGPTIRTLGVSRAFARWLTRALDQRPTNRFGSAAEAAAALAIQAPGVGRRLLQVAGGLGALAVVAGAVLGGQRLLEPTPAPAVHPDLVEELCPAGAVLGGDVTDQFCQTHVGERLVRNGVSVKYETHPALERRAVEISHYQDGVLHGEFTRPGRLPGEVRAAGSYVDGKRQGHWKLDEREGELVDGREDGVWTTTSSEGQLRRTESFVQGVSMGPATLYTSDNQKETETSLRAGRMEGKTTTFFRSGKVRSVAHYSRGILDGPFVEYTEEGNKKQAGSYVKNGKQGEWTEYFPDGSVASIGIHPAGVRGPVDLTELRPGGAKKAEWHADPATGRLLSSVEYFDDGKKWRQIGPCEDPKAPAGSRCRIEYYASGKRAANCGVTALTMETRDGKQLEGPCLEWYENGLRKSEGAYLWNERRVGTWKTYWPNGKLKRLENHASGSLVGEYKEYFESGQLRISGSWVSGTKKGVWIERWPNGALVSRQDFGD